MVSSQMLSQNQTSSKPSRFQNLECQREARADVQSSSATILAGLRFSTLLYPRYFQVSLQRKKLSRSHLQVHSSKACNLSWYHEVPIPKRGRRSSKRSSEGKSSSRLTTYPTNPSQSSPKVQPQTGQCFSHSSEEHLKA